MKHLKLFEQFIYEYHSNVPDGNQMGSLSKKRAAQGNWFTKEEIEEIREGARSIGIPLVGESNVENDENYFGDSNGIGLEESWEEFVRGGNLCGEVHLSTGGGEYTIVKKSGKFMVNDNEVGINVSDAISAIS